MGEMFECLNGTGELGKVKCLNGGMFECLIWGMGKWGN